MSTDSWPKTLFNSDRARGVARLVVVLFYWGLPLGVGLPHVADYLEPKWYLIFFFILVVQSETNHQLFEMPAQKIISNKLLASTKHEGLSLPACSD